MSSHEEYGRGADTEVERLDTGTKEVVKCVNMWLR